MPVLCCDNTRVLWGCTSAPQQRGERRARGGRSRFVSCPKELASNKKLVLWRGQSNKEHRRESHRLGSSWMGLMSNDGFHEHFLAGAVTGERFPGKGTLIAVINSHAHGTLCCTRCH